MTREAQTALQSVLDDCVAAGAPGASLVVSMPGAGFHFAGASGLFERGRPRKLAPDDPFRAASVSKAVTAAAAVRLAARERWSLDGSVAPFLPPRVAGLLRHMDGLERLEELTLRRLLGHRSGLPDYFFDERFQARVEAEPDRTWQAAELVEAAAEAGKLDFAPGTGFAYGDTGYVVVGLAIEALTQSPLADACRSLVLAPLGMDATWLEWHEPRRGGEVSHHYDGERDLLPMNTSFDWAAGGLVTTAGDLVRFIQGLFDRKLFGARWLAQMTAWDDSVRWRPGSSARYERYGLGIGTNRAAGEEIVGATGVWGAFAYFWPAAGATIAGTLNQRGADRASLLDAVVGALRSHVAPR